MRTRLTMLMVAVLAAVSVVVADDARSAQMSLEAGRKKEVVDGDLKGAIALYQRAVDQAGPSRQVAAQALLALGIAYQKTGTGDARTVFAQIVKDFGDQKEIAAAARVRLAGLAADQPTRSEVTATLLWSGPDAEAATADLSADGRTLAFEEYASSKGVVANLGVRDVATGQERLLTHSTSVAEGFVDSLVRISADGRHVAYNWMASGALANQPKINPNGFDQMGLIDTDGSHARMLPWDGDAEVGGWSPDGKQIAAMLHPRLDGHMREIALISATDLTITPVKSIPEPGRVTLGGFSPDGRFLVYSVRKSAVWAEGDVHALAIDGSRDTLLASGADSGTWYERPPIWTADGNAVAFVSRRLTTPALFAVQVRDGRPLGSPEVIRRNAGQFGTHGFLRDGSYFYGTANAEPDVYVAEIDPNTFKVVLQPKQLLDRFIGSNGSPVWSPDGSSVAFARSGAMPDAPGTIVIRSISGSSERAVPGQFGLRGMGGYLEWFPDGRSLLVRDLDVTSGSPRFTFFKVDTDTGARQSLFAGEYVQIAGLSPDGKFFYFSRRATEPEADGKKPKLLIRRDLDTGVETALYREPGPGMGFGASVSPDGSQVALFGRTGTDDVAVMTMPSGGGTPKVIYRGNAIQDPAQPTTEWSAWTKDSRYVLVPANGERVNRLWALPAAGGAPIKTDLTMRGLMTIDVAPDGRHLAFYAAQRRPEFWLIKNLISSPSPAAAK
jgi:Tol biopolymer transport system component